MPLNAGIFNVWLTAILGEDSRWVPFELDPTFECDSADTRSGFSGIPMPSWTSERTGQLVFESRDAGQKWEGKINGKLQVTGSYIWILNYADGSGRPFSLKGTSVLIR